MTDEPVVTEESEERRPRRGRGRGKAAPETPAPKPAPRRPAQPTIRRVVLRNRRGQMLTPSVLNDHGAPETLRLGPYQRSAEIFEDRITAYTRDLVAQGHLSIDTPR